MSDAWKKKKEREEKAWGFHRYESLNIFVVVTKKAQNELNATYTKIVAVFLACYAQSSFCLFFVLFFKLVCCRPRKRSRLTLMVCYRTLCCIMYVVLRLVNRFNVDGLLQNPVLYNVYRTKIGKQINSDGLLQTPVLYNVYRTKIGNEINAMVCYRRLCCIMYIVLKLVMKLTLWFATYACAV